MKPSIKGMKTKLVLFLFWRIGAFVEYLNRCTSMVGGSAFFNLEVFPWVFEVESEWSVIRAELDELLLRREELPNLHDISEELWPPGPRDDGWKIFAMIFAGSRVEKNCERCPNTMRILERVPDLRTAVFSVLAPGKHIPEHRGYYNGVIRYQLGLIVPGPSGACGIRVGDKVRYWEEGKSLVFDDTIRHEVWNHAERDRIVLYVDFLRPLSFPMSLMNKAFITIFSRPFVKEAHRKIREWDEKISRSGGRSETSGDLPAGRS